MSVAPRSTRPASIFIAPEQAMSVPMRSAGFTGRDWLAVLRRYMVAIAAGNLVWEFAHMPLYTLWETGTWGDIVFAAVHCTGGDVLIALSAVVLALFLVGSADWPQRGYPRVAAAAVAIGLGYTIFSEWLNIEVRGAWAYRDLMPVIPLIDAGLSPVAQWLVLPLLSFWWARAGSRRGGPAGRADAADTCLDPPHATSSGKG